MYEEVQRPGCRVRQHVQPHTGHGRQHSLHAVVEDVVHSAQRLWVEVMLVCITKEDNCVTGKRLQRVVCGDPPVNQHLKGPNSLECLVKVAVSLDGRPGEVGEQGVQCLLQLGDMRHQQWCEALAHLAQHSGVFIQQVLETVLCTSL